MSAIYETREVIGSAEIKFPCSYCQTENLTDAFRFKTVDKFYGLFPIWITHETVLKCPACEATHTSSIALNDLTEMTSEELARRFAVRVGFVEKFLVVTGWIMVWVPPLSLLFFTIARFKVPRAARRWQRSIGFGLLASGVLTLLLAIMLTIDAMT